MRTLAARFAALAVCSGAVAACSLLLNTKADQCASDRDCAGFKHANTCVQGICVSTTGDGATGDSAVGDDDGAADVFIPPTTCNANADCANPNTVCQTSTHTCMSLTSADCPTVLGDYKNDNALVFGAILPSVIGSPPDYFAGLQETGVSMQAGLSLAVDDFASAKNPSKGIPPQPGKTAARPMVFVVCSDNESAASTAAATTHLVNNLNVPVIVGTAFSTYSRAIVSTLASLNKPDVLVMTPRSSDLVPADNGGVFTRLAPTDAAQGAAIAALYANREPGWLSEADAGSTNLKIVLAYKEDSYGNGVAAAIKANFSMKGVPLGGGNANFHEFKYGNPDSANYSSQFASTTLGIVNVRPNVIIFVGTNEIVPGILSQVEANWAESGYRPHYLMSDGTVTKELWSYLATHDTSDTIRKRILGTIPMGTPDHYAAFAAAFSAKSAQQNAIVYGAAGLYDAAYMIAYATSSIGDKAVTGPNIQDGFGLLAQGGGALAVGVGPDDITATFAKMQSGQPVNLEGASSGLDVDPTSRTVTNVTTQVWCIPSAGGQAQPAILSGQTIDPANAVQGTVSAACGQ